MKKERFPGFQAEMALQETTRQFAGVFRFETDARAAAEAAAVYCHCYPCVSRPDGSVGYCCDCYIWGSPLPM